MLAAFREALCYLETLSPAARPRRFQTAYLRIHAGTLRAAEAALRAGEGGVGAARAALDSLAARARELEDICLQFYDLDARTRILLRLKATVLRLLSDTRAPSAGGQDPTVDERPPGGGLADPALARVLGAMHPGLPWDEALRRALPVLAAVPPYAFRASPRVSFQLHLAVVPPTASAGGAPRATLRVQGRVRAATAAARATGSSSAGASAFDAAATAATRVAVCRLDVRLLMQAQLPPAASASDPQAPQQQQQHIEVGNLQATAEFTGGYFDVELPVALPPLSAPAAVAVQPAATSAAATPVLVIIRPTVVDRNGLVCLVGQPVRAVLS
ncbi:hypothetical protein HK405_014367 [Cladochytrium tenue]|nr:hypothetical protein HK405_014367 [Cladochytrium tenue]